MMFEAVSPGTAKGQLEELRRAEEGFYDGIKAQIELTHPKSAVEQMQEMSAFKFYKDLQAERRELDFRSRLPLPSFADRQGELLRTLQVQIAHLLSRPAPFPETPQMPSVESKGSAPSFPTPTGTTWSWVSIAPVDDERVSIRVGKTVRTLNFTQLGLVDARDARADEQWDLLQTFLRRGGTLAWSDSEADQRNQKRKERLARILKRFMGIKGDPFELIEYLEGGKWRRAWKAGFQVLPPK